MSAATPGTALAAQEVHALTPAEAGTPPEPGTVWSPQLQRFVPRGQQFALDRAEREADPAFMLAAYDRQHTAVLQFIGAKLREAEYDEKGYPLRGRMHDYYILPSYDKKTITKGGASKVMAFLRHRVAERAVTHAEFGKEHGSARVRVQLVDAFGQPVGAYEAACSTAEAGFQAVGARKKYGARGAWEQREWVETDPPDYRAAENDVVARAGKRAVVGAEIIAASLEEVFDLQSSTGTDEEDEEEGRPATAAKEPAEEQAHGGGSRLPVTLDTVWPSSKQGAKWYGKTVRQIGHHGFSWLKGQLEEDRKTNTPVYLFVLDALAALETPTAPPPEDAAPSAGPLVPEPEPTEPESVRDEIIRLALDPAIAQATRDTWGGMYAALGESATADDLNRIVTNLRSARAKAAAASSKP